MMTMSCADVRVRADAACAGSVGPHGSRRTHAHEDPRLAVSGVMVAGLRWLCTPASAATNQISGGCVRTTPRSGRAGHLAVRVRGLHQLPTAGDVGGPGWLLVHARSRRPRTTRSPSGVYMESRSRRSSSAASTARCGGHASPRRTGSQSPVGPRTRPAAGSVARLVASTPSSSVERHRRLRGRHRHDSTSRTRSRPACTSTAGHDQAQAVALARSPGRPVLPAWAAAHARVRVASPQVRWSGPVTRTSGVRNRHSGPTLHTFPAHFSRAGA